MKSGYIYLLLLSIVFGILLISGTVSTSSSASVWWVGFVIGILVAAYIFISMRNKNGS